MPRAAALAVRSAFTLETLEDRRLLSASFLDRFQDLMNPSPTRDPGVAVGPAPGTTPPPTGTTPPPTTGAPGTPPPATTPPPARPPGNNNAPPPQSGAPTLPPARPGGGLGRLPTGSDAGVNGALTFVLVNAETGTTIARMWDGMVIDLSELPTKDLAIVVEAGPAVESIQFGLNGIQNFRIESDHNFALGGDNGNKGWRPHEYIPGLGSHVLTATPFSGDEASGARGQAQSIRFTLVDSNPGFGSSPKFPGLGVRPITPPTYLPGEPPPPAPVYTPEPVQQNTPGNNAPSVVLNSSAFGNIAGPGYFVLKADASDPDGPVRKVEFYANDTFLGAAEDAPFMISWSDVPVGGYQVTARVLDHQGGESRSAPVTINIVNPVQGRTIEVGPGGSIEAAANSAGPGDTVLVRAGVYRESVTVERSGTSVAPITFYFEPGAVLQGTTTAFVANGGKWVVVKGLTVEGANNERQGQNAAVRTGNNWRLEDVTVRGVKNTGIGVKGSTVTLLRVTSESNGQNGISSPGGDWVLMKDSVIRNNNLDLHNPASEGGGGKWARTNNVYITGLETYDNIGPGLWFDINNRDFVITQSVAHHNRGLRHLWEGPGFMTEINQGPVRIEYNLTYDNAGAGIQICETEDLNVIGNVIVNDTIEMRNLLRPDGAWKLEDVNIGGNLIRNGYIDTSPAGERWTPQRGKEWRISIDHNRYENRAGDQIFRWGGANIKTIADARERLGFEHNGQMI